MPTTGFSQDGIEQPQGVAAVSAPAPKLAASFSGATGPAEPSEGSDVAEARAELPAEPKPVASPALPQAGNERPGPRRIGVGVKISMFGIGGEAAVALTRRINVRGGFSGLGYSTNFSSDGIDYAAKLAFRSADAHFDFFPFAGGFHLSPGLLFYNGNSVSATASVGANQTFSLGGVNYSSSPANPILGTAKLDFNKAAPMFTIGFGNMIPRSRRRWAITSEFGVAYTGAPKASLSLTGTACSTIVVAGKAQTQCVNAATDPTVQSNVQSEVAKVNHDVSVIKIWPVASVGFAVNF